MGCNLQMSSKQEIYRHLYESHTFEELEMWGIKRDLLVDNYVGGVKEEARVGKRAQPCKSKQKLGG